MANSPSKRKRDKKGRFKKASRLEFPQIIRKITAPHVAKALRGRLLSWRLVVILLIVSLLLLNFIRFGQNLYTSYQEAQEKQAQEQAIEAEIAKWGKVIQERPNYRDAYFELAVLTYRLGRIEESKKHLDKVFELDPNYEPARELEKILGY